MAQWEMAIKMAFQKNIANVEELKFTDIKNFKDPVSLPQYAHILQRATYENKDGNDPFEGNKILWSKITQIKFTKQQPGEMLFKYSYLDAGSRSRRQGINKDKYDALLKLCSKNLIPEQHHQFYKELPIAD